MTAQCQGSLPALRAQIIGSLDDISESAKSQQALLNSCSDATWITDEERGAVRWLLSALIEHRRRVRVIARLWRTLGPDEPVGGALAAETAELIDENAHFRPFIEQWRSVVTERTRLERQAFWRQMIELAELNLR